MNLIILDGGLSTALEQRGHHPAGLLWTAEFLIHQPDEVVAAHRAYVEAGAEVIITASYQASVEGFLQAGCDATRGRELLALTTELARRAGAPRVAASVSSYGAILGDGSEFHGRYEASWETVRKFHRERLAVLAESGPDLFAIETIPSGVEAEIIVEELGKRTSAKAWLSFTCKDEMHTWSGEPVEKAAARVTDSQTLLAVGVNCTAHRLVSPLLERLQGVFPGPLLAYPNQGGSWDAREGWQGADILGLDWEELVPAWWKRGARWVGGCCGVGPGDIARLARWARRAPGP